MISLWSEKNLAKEAMKNCKKLSEVNTFKPDTTLEYNFFPLPFVSPPLSYFDTYSPILPQFYESRN